MLSAPAKQAQVSRLPTELARPPSACGSAREGVTSGSQMQALSRSVTTNQDAVRIVRRVLGTRVLPAAAGHSEPSQTGFPW
jgi:hypothetical protein